MKEGSHATTALVNLLHSILVIVVVVGISTAPTLAKNKEKSATPQSLAPFSFMGLGAMSSVQDLIASLDKAYSEKNLEPYGYNKQAPSEQCRSTLKGPMGECMLSSVNIAGVSAQYISYEFADNHLTSIMISMSHYMYDKFKDMLVAKYGEPASTSVEEYSNGYGAKFKGQRLQWNFSDGTATFSQIGAKIDTSSFSFISNAAVNKQDQERSRAVERAKNAL